MKKPQQISGQLLDNLRQRSQLHEQLLDVTRSAFPPEVAEQCDMAVLQQRKLIILTTSANWASAIRFGQNGVREAFQSKLGVELDEIKVRVHAANEHVGSWHRKPISRKRPEITDAAGEVLMEAAIAQQGSDLGLALARLAARAVPNED